MDRIYRMEERVCRNKEDARLDDGYFHRRPILSILSNLLPLLALA
jgi:hypothetical protein